MTGSFSAFPAAVFSISSAVIAAGTVTIPCGASRAVTDGKDHPGFMVISEYL
jgi:hypothetical protein